MESVRKRIFDEPSRSLVSYAGGMPPLRQRAAQTPDLPNCRQVKESTYQSKQHHGNADGIIVKVAVRETQDAGRTGDGDRANQEAQAAQRREGCADALYESQE